MAWYFMAAIECGPERDAAQAVSRHFEGLSVTLPDGFTTICWTSESPDERGNWWSSVLPRGAHYAGYFPEVRGDGTIQYRPDPRLVQSHAQVGQIALALYRHLTRAPRFRYALVGYETQHFRDRDELREDLPDLDLPGLVLSETLWSDGTPLPARYVPFAPGYIWQPCGEEDFTTM